MSDAKVTADMQRMTIEASWSDWYYENGQRYHKGHNLTVTPEGFEFSETGSLSMGTMRNDNVAGEWALARLRAVRAGVASGKGQARVVVCFYRAKESPTVPGHFFMTEHRRVTHWRQGSPGPSIYDERDWDRETVAPTRSPAACMLASYLQTGDETFLRMLDDHLTEHARCSSLFAPVAP